MMRSVFEHMVSRGMEDVRQGRVISNEEMEHHLSAFKDWLKTEEDEAWAHLQPVAR